MKNLIIFLAFLGLAACGSDSSDSSDSVSTSCIDSDIQGDWSSSGGRQTRFDLSQSRFNTPETVDFEYNGTECSADIIIRSNNDCTGTITIEGLTLENGNGNFESCVDFPVDTPFSFSLLNDNDGLRICNGNDCYNHTRN